MQNIQLTKETKIIMLKALKDSFISVENAKLICEKMGVCEKQITFEQARELIKKIEEEI